MTARLQPDGSILVPFRAAGERGEVGDGLRRIEPGDPDYQQALADLERDLQLERERQAEDD